MIEDLPDPAALLHALVEDAADYAFIVLDAEGMITHWNRGAEALFRFAPPEILGRHVSVLFTIEDVRASVPEEELARAVRDGRSEDTRWHTRADSTRFFATGITRVVRAENGEVLGFSKLARDISDLKKSEEERERLLVRERQLNLDKDHFFAAVSHELRTPLTALTGWLALIDHSGSDAAVVTEGLSNMKRSVEMLTRLAGDLLDAVRTRTARMDIAPQPVNLHTIVAGSIEAFRPAFESKPVTVSLQLEEQAIVAGDPTRLHQVVWNVLSNAIRHTPPGGMIDVTMHCEQREAVVEIRDSGEGIDPSLLASIFEPFHQNRGKTGTLGLGLSIARSLVELHHGRIAARSDGPGSGATFVIHLPLLDMAGKGASREDAPAQANVSR